MATSGVQPRPRLQGVRAAFISSAGCLAALLAAACADAPAVTTPAAEPRLGAAVGLGGSDQNVPLAVPVRRVGLARNAPLAADVVYRFVATRRGGSYAVPGTGLTIVVPQQAIPGDTLTVTVTALAGPALAYEFEPHGTRFGKPLRMTQELSGTDWGRMPTAPFDVSYFADRGAVDLSADAVAASELLPGYLDARGARLQFDVYHFSGYMVSWGFRDFSEAW